MVFWDALAVLLNAFEKYRKYMFDATFSIAVGLLLALSTMYFLKELGALIAFGLGFVVSFYTLLLLLKNWKIRDKLIDEISLYVTEAFFVLKELGYNIFERIKPDGSVNIKGELLQKIQNYLNSTDSVISKGDFKAFCNQWKKDTNCRMPDLSKFETITNVIFALLTYVVTVLFILHFGLFFSCQNCFDTYLIYSAVLFTIFLSNIVALRYFDIPSPEIAVIIDKEGVAHITGVVRDLSSALKDGYVHIIQPVTMNFVLSKGCRSETLCSTVAIPLSEVRAVRFIDTNCVLRFACKILGIDCENRGDQNGADKEKAS